MHGACARNPMGLKLTRDDLFRMASGARGRAEGQLESMATGNTLMVPLSEEKAQVLSRRLLHNGNWQCRRVWGRTLRPTQLLDDDAYSGGVRHRRRRTGGCDGDAVIACRRSSGLRGTAAAITASTAATYASG
jgi:hypothetical protein